MKCFSAKLHVVIRKGKERTSPEHLDKHSVKNCILIQSRRFEKRDVDSKLVVQCDVFRFRFCFEFDFTCTCLPDDTR